MGSSGVHRGFLLAIALFLLLGSAAASLTPLETLVRSNAPAGPLNADPLMAVTAGFDKAVAASPGRPFPSAETPFAKPTMGWNSWNHFGSDGLTETLVRETADAMVDSGLLAAGYDVVALDDGWSARSRDENGDLTNDPVDFPSGMKALGDYIHGKGLRFGIYASIGRSTCTGEDPGSLDHEFQDVATFASWGVDYIKADRCDASGLVMKDVYARWRDAIAASGRSIVLSASDNNPTDEPWAWGPVTAHQWRMSGDISDDWTDPPGQPSWKQGMIDIFDRNAAHAAATAPGTFNDPDMLEVGNGGMTDTEYRTHFGLWALMSAPLIAGNDVRDMRPEIRDILTNPEVIAVDQDPLAFQAILASDAGDGRQVWYKPISENGGRAVGLLNRRDAAATMVVRWTSIGLAAGSATVRDLWARADRGTFVDSYIVSVPAHGLALLRVIGTDPAIEDGSLSDQPWTYMANELGPVERDSSNGGSGAGDGRSIRLNDVPYAKGLGAHAPSALEFRTGGACSTFTADVGIDDEVGDAGSVLFQVWGDGEKLFESGVMTGAMAAEEITVDITGRRSMRLQAVALDTTADDHADWADARVVCGPAGLPNEPPVASFLPPPPLVSPGEAVTFDGAASTDPDGTIVTYLWDFGDGSSGEGPFIDHTYVHSGRFDVVLTVTDDSAASDTATAEVIVDLRPTAHFTVSPPEAMPGEPMTFDASGSTDADGSIISYVWAFGDGQTAEGRVRTHTYFERGAFPVRLTVTDDLGVQGEMVRTLGIANRAPVITAFTPGDPVVLTVSESESFRVVATDPDGDSLTYSWNVDGVAAGGPGPTHTFVATDAGSHRLTVHVSDGVASATFTWAVEVRAGAPTAGFGETSALFVAVAVMGVSAFVVASVAWFLRRRTR